MSHEIVLEGPWLAPVVQRADTGNSIHRINHFPVDSELCFVNIYLLHSDLSVGWCYPSFKQPGPGDSPFKKTNWQLPYGVGM